MSTDVRNFAFISLLRDELEARGLAGLLESVARSSAEVTSVFLAPPVRGLDFFAAPRHQAEVDRWWGRHIPASSVPVYLLCHEEGLAAWLRGLDGVSMVAASQHQAELYADWTVVDADPAAAPLALAEATIIRFGVPSGPEQPSLADVFNRRDARMVANLRLDISLVQGSRPEFPPLLHVDGIRAPTVTSRPASPDAMELLIAESTRAMQPLPSWDERQRPVRPTISATSRLRSRLPLWRRRSAASAAGDRDKRTTSLGQDGSADD